MTRFLALPALVLGLAACEPVPLPITDPEPGTGVPDTCGAAALSPLIGQNAGVLETARFDRPVRIIRPGDVVTLDFNPERLNFRIGADGRIAEITCG